MPDRLFVLVVLLSSLLIACGDDGSNNDTILGGFSGILVFGVIVWVVFRYVSKRKG